MFGGDFTRRKIKIYLKNKNENNITELNSNCIVQKNKITYKDDKYKYTIKIISSNKLILIRENEEMINTMYFEKNKYIPSQYILKENNITIEIDIKTKELIIEKNLIKINYIIKDSEEEFEYYIEMSD